MNKILVELIAQYAIFLELTDETELSTDCAVQQQEAMSVLLQQLEGDERQAFLQALASIADQLSDAEQRDVLTRLPSDFGLV